jgi:ATP-dependent DNA helicase RecG
MDFLEVVLRVEERTGKAMPLDSLNVLSRLRTERRLNIADFVPSLQKSEQEARRTIEKLTEAGLVEAHGTGRGRTYTLSARMYRGKGQKVDYVRQAGFDPIQQEQMVLTYIEKHGSIKRADVMELCRINKDQAYKLLNR